LKLTTNGKLEYYEPEKYYLKGTIILNSESNAIHLDKFTFEIITKSRKYLIKVSL
jgi:hypothetical protein